MSAVPYPPSGLVIALQYWAGDETRALRLARLLADIEQERRTDLTLALCRRFDCPISQYAVDTYVHCSPRFDMMLLRSERTGTGHPAGCNDLWSGTAEQLAWAWQVGRINTACAFFVEADGCPLRVDWSDLMLDALDSARRRGKRVIGHLMGGHCGRIPHVNGTLAMDLSLWPDRPSLHRTPPAQAWDLFHAQALAAETDPTNLVQNVYGAVDWAPGVLSAFAEETAWLASTKDDSAISWAERELPRLARAGFKTPTEERHADSQRSI